MPPRPIRKDDTLKIIQITDTHLVPPGNLVNGVDPELQLRRTLDDVLARHADADLLVITGDLCNDGDPEAYALLREILSSVPFPIRLMLGNHDRRPAFVDAFPDHPSGHAADFMVGTSPSGRTKGDRLAAYVQKHHKELGVDYVIWYQRIWSPARNGEGWRPMDDRGSPTANHMDHVHITFKGDASDGELPAVTGGCEPGDGGGEAVAGDGERVKPAEGPITSPFGLRAHPTRGGTRMHEGIDIGAPCEAPIKATSSGRVIYAGPMSGYGHMIEIDHGKGTTSRYGHMYANGLLTRVGARVKTGQRIASVGSDGASTGCHLHFEIRVKDQPTDPQAWLSGGKRKN